jgi:hypothetical protein
MFPRVPPPLPPRPSPPPSPSPPLPSPPPALPPPEPPFPPDRADVAELALLAVSDAKLSPRFAAEMLQYTGHVPWGVQQVRNHPHRPREKQ